MLVASHSEGQRNSADVMGTSSPEETVLFLELFQVDAE
jgi:hypothetical protein